MLKLGFNSTQSHASAVGGDCDDGLIKVTHPTSTAHVQSWQRQHPQLRPRSYPQQQPLPQPPAHAHIQPSRTVFLPTPQTDDEEDDADDEQEEEDNAPDLDEMEYCMVTQEQAHDIHLHADNDNDVSHSHKNKNKSKNKKRSSSMHHVHHGQEEEEEEEKKTQPYFEKQQWEMCLLHSLNALYQQTRFSTKDLDEICQQLAPNKLINPHKSIFQTGNWDCNVLFMALQKEGVEVQWFDSRKAAAELRLDDSFLCPKHKYAQFLGFIINNTHKRMIVFNRRHWLTIKRINGVWYNLDSLLKEPVKYEGIKGTRKLQKWLIDALVNNDAQLMICRVPLKKQ